MARPRTNIEPRIIAAARATFARSGVDGSSLREIAKRAKTSIGMIYYYFPTKDDLFHAVVEEVYGKLLTDLETILSSEGDVEAKLLRLYCRVGETTELERLTLRLIFTEMLVSPTRRARLMERFAQGHLAMILGSLLQGVKQGKLRGDLHPAVLLTSAMSIGAAPQFVLKALAGVGPFATVPQGEALAKDLLGVVLRGIGAQR
jgi:AcrR family transcriptional regulator